jgi:hypothetical protein
LRAVPYVLAAPPGIVVPSIFGAYRWPVDAATPRSVNPPSQSG